MSASLAYELDTGATLKEPIDFEAEGLASKSDTSLRLWLRSQRINSSRHAAALRPFRPGEFGAGPASPSEAHRLAANRLILTLRNSLLKTSKQLSAGGIKAQREPVFTNLRAFTELKDRSQRWVTATEKVWDFYFELFNQRQSRVAGQLLAADRVGLNCYQAIYTGLGTARSIPSPPPFSYLETGFAPATFRRGVALSLLGKQANPFPLIKLPYHRLVNPWTLGAIPHEVSHNLQADLGLWQLLPQEIERRLTAAGIDRASARIWARWHKEIFADLCGLLLSGPSFVSSLMDIVGKSPARTLSFNPRGVHPTPYLRVFINLELLRRMDFEREARAFRRTWDQLYPSSLARAIPQPLRQTFPSASQLVVETICFTAYPQLGRKALAQVVRYAPKDHVIVQEAASRLAAGTSTGILPERFLIGAARWALDHQLARPGVITKNFYEALGRR